MPALKSGLIHPACKTEYRVRNWGTQYKFPEKVNTKEFKKYVALLFVLGDF